MDIPKELKINQKLFEISFDNLSTSYFFTTNYHSKIWLRHGNLERKKFIPFYTEMPPRLQHTLKYQLIELLNLAQGLKYNEKKLHHVVFWVWILFILFCSWGFFINYYFKA